ncbi:hypothetical protein KUTeg_019772 [Tegillarca granosa]|uniref:Uncharacterized protein n=1 Tax=Tegillarca granosa TaxID=220873 RepID=A0ABQ9EG27_TEGGR|nr:hypothetical protein KUTeg_019772 [Tegillarca granosa]
MKWFRHRKNTISEVMPEFKKHSKSVTVSKIVTESYRPNDEAAVKMNQQNGKTEPDSLTKGETEQERLQNGATEKEKPTQEESYVNTPTIDVQVSEEEQISEQPQTTATETELPWKTRLSEDQALQISSCLLITSDEPCTAEAPTWVDNLSYNHLKESLSPYASPEVTVIAVKENIKTPVFDLFPKQNGNNDVALPVPWSKESIDSNGKDDEPVSSLAVLNRSGDKSDQYLQSNHMLRPPSYHVIIPTPDSGSVSQDFDDEFHKPLRTLPGSASAPDLPKHRQLLEHFTRDQLHTESFLQELNFQEEVSNRVQDWLESSGSCDVNGDPDIDTTLHGEDEGITIEIPEKEITHL